MRILIAEDERITRRSLQKQLDGWGHDVLAAKDGAEAWEQFRKRPFDIVVTDWDMPRMDGQELIECIRRSGQPGYTYLIMLTGRSQKADLVTGMEAGADDYLAKPFDRNELRVRLNAGERIIQLERKLAARNEALSQANDRMKRDLDAAAKMQRDLLPKQLPDTLGANFAWHFEPCDELGGDILNVLPLAGHGVAMYLLDVTGHGVPAALLSVTLSRVLTTRDPSASILVAQGAGPETTVVEPPRNVATRLNRQFPMDTQGGRFFTMVYAVLHTETGLLRFANMGHPPPILARHGSAPEELTGGGLPVGILKDQEYDDLSVQLASGDRLYFYSDGITEATNDRGEMLKTAGLSQLIENTRANSLSEDLASCIVELKRWCGPVPFADDISLLALEMPSAD
jgi:sigma-B regulation protein RsbU (phosphoserine phosphatase)